LREIDAIAWPVIDAHFPDRSADRSGVAGVASLEPEQPLGDAKAGVGVTQVPQPLRELVGLANFGHWLR
jgi:hypothetical protein